MANRLMSMNHNTSQYGMNVLQNYYKNRPLADIENKFKIYLEDDPFEYKKLINRPETTTTTMSSKSLIKSDNEEDEVIKRAIKSAPVQNLEKDRKPKRDNKRVSKFDSKSDPKLNRDRSDSIKRKRVKKKKRSKSTMDLSFKEDSNFGQFLVLSMDELGYSQRKKELNEQIHQHWKQDSAQLAKQSKSNKDQNSENQQWIPIVSDASSAFKSNSSNTLIETFTNVSTERNAENVYHVSSDIGSLIAQKLEKGVKLYICRNGELVNSRSDKNVINSKSSNRTAIQDLFDEMEIPAPTPLSWQDQILKSGGNIRGARKQEVKIVDKPKHERKLYVKKLIDEEEFKPKIKQELEKKFLITHTTKPKVDPFIVNTTRSNINTKNAKVTSVEIIGVNNTKQQKTQVQEDTAEEVLNEKQYNQIIENLTKQYTSRKKIQIDETKTAKEISDQEYVTELLNKYPPPPPPPTTTQQHRGNQPPPPPPTVSNSSTPLRINFQSLTNDYAISSELLNRKKQTSFNINKAYAQVLQNNNTRPHVSREQIRSRPNSPNLSIILTKKSDQSDKSSIVTKHSTNNQPQQQPVTLSRTNTQSSIIRINPISNAIKTSKSHKNNSHAVESMFINIASSIGPTLKQDLQQGRRNIVDPYDRKNSSLHNPSVIGSSFETPSRLY